MIRRKRPINISVRKQGGIIEIRLYDCYEDRYDYFRAKARVNNQEEMRTLLSALESKGVSLAHKDEGKWW